MMVRDIIVFRLRIKTLVFMDTVTVNHIISGGVLPLPGVLLMMPRVKHKARAPCLAKELEVDRAVRNHH